VGQGPSNAWDENIEALQGWTYLDSGFADELRDLYKDVRCKYLHSGPIGDMAGEAIRIARARLQIDRYLSREVGSLGT